MRRWQRELIRNLNRIANDICRCENNGDLCPRCDAREQLHPRRREQILKEKTCKI